MSSDADPGPDPGDPGEAVGSFGVGSTESPAIPLAMFPLGCVLFPHAPLPLRVFEPRYRALVADCLRTDRKFGVVLIERGSEVGGGDTRFEVGTIARIVGEAELPDGQWLLATQGTQRVRVAAWLPDDPYPLALIEVVPEPRMTPADLDAFRVAERAVRRGLALAAELALGPAMPSGVALAEDPDVASWQLCAIAPVGPVDQQRLLNESDPGPRMQLLERLASDAAELLRLRLSSGG